jgi:hypothetical protein
MRTRLALTLAAALVLVPAAVGSRADNPVLVGDVGAGDGFVISLADASGAKVSHLDPGTYTIVVHDHSTIHDFHLTGPGVDQTTRIDAIEDVTWTVTLGNGTYKFVCDPHALDMKGSFTVGTVPTPAPAPAPTPAAPRRLTGTVGPGQRISLVDASGGRVGSLDAGAFVITVRDRSASDNFRLTGPGVAKATGVAFKGTASWRVTLGAGTYTFRSDKHAKLRGRFSVAGSGAAGGGAGGGGIYP